MAWLIEFTPEAEKQLAKIDRKTAKRITRFLSERVAEAENPRELGHSLKGALREFWRFRVGDYRILTRVEDNRLVVLVVRIGHRRQIYR